MAPRFLLNSDGVATDVGPAPSSTERAACSRCCCRWRCPIFRRSPPSNELPPASSFGTFHSAVSDHSLLSTRSGSSSASASASETDPSELLSKLLAVERRCRSDGSDSRGGGSEMDMKVECLLQSQTAQMWLCRSVGCPVVTACIHVRIADVAVGEAVAAIADPQERMKWDSESFKVYEVLRPSTPDDPHGEILWCVASAPWPFRDRDFLQRRCYVPLPDGGSCMLIQSIEDSELRPKQNAYVRAITHFSGYLFKPIDGKDLEITIITRCDLGGLIPKSAQNLVNRLAKQRPVSFAYRLGEHCRSMREITNLSSTTSSSSLAQSKARPMRAETKINHV